MAFRNQELDHMIQYVLTEAEMQLFLDILVKDEHNDYIAFILSLLKELDYNIYKLLRIMAVASKTRGIFPKALVNRILMTIREVIIISDISEREVLDDITISDLTRTNRYQELSISRSLVYKTMGKHNITL